MKITHINEIVEEEIRHVSSPENGQADQRPELGRGAWQHEILNPLHSGSLQQLCIVAPPHVHSGTGDHHLIHPLRPHLRHAIRHKSAVARPDHGISEGDRTTISSPKFIVKNQIANVLIN